LGGRLREELDQAIDRLAGRNGPRDLADVL
jgi:hypothetical protein